MARVGWWLVNAPALLTEIAEAWNRRGVRYAVAHGLEGYPDRLGRDVDVLVQASHVGVAVSAAADALEAHGLIVVHLHPIWGPRIVAVEPTSRAMLELHLITELNWRGAALITAPNATRSVGPIAVDPELSFAKRIIAPLLAGNTDKFDCKPDEFRFDEGEAVAASSLLARIMDADLGLALHRSIGAGDVAAAIAIAPAVRRSILLRGLTRTPLRFAARSLRSVTRKLSQPFAASAPTVALVGPDGAGKSTLIRGLLARDHGVFTNVVVRHWRPQLLPRLGAFVNAPAPTPSSDGAVQPRRHAGRWNGLRLGYYYLDFLVGGWIKDRVANSRQQLVLYDRCALDMQIDPVRYGLRSGAFHPLARRLLPWPELVILLRCDAERIHARKPELPVSELQRQLDAWQRLVDRGEVHAVLTTEGPVDAITEEAWGLITEAFIAANRTRRGPDPPHASAATVKVTEAQ